jgi:SAM-dependent methyltransferase
VEREDWNRRHGESGQLFGVDPNRFLVAEVVDLAPGRALDLACGAGRNAVWLAERGWTVTGVDFSAVGLENARRLAGDRGVEIEWLVADVRKWVPESAAFDLVAILYLQIPVVERCLVHGRAAAAVAPGGTLLVVGHDPTDAETTMPRHGLLERGWTAGDMAEWLGDSWVIDVAEARPRQVVDPEGREVTIHDAVVRARRI